MFKIVGAGSLVLLLAACNSPEIRDQPPPPAGPAAQQIPPSRPNTYRIDPTQSELRVLVYRDGVLAHFGHNHVMLNRALHGDVTLERNFPESAFTLIAPVAAFTVDDVEARHEEGADFATEVPDEARSGTFRNMMSSAVLNAAEYPEVTIKSVAIEDRVLGADAGRMPTTEGPKTIRYEVLVTVDLTVRARNLTLQVPVNVQVDSGRVIATGAFQLKQSALGITPFSLMLGALSVQDTMNVRFRIIALQVQ